MSTEQYLPLNNDIELRTKVNKDVYSSLLNLKKVLGLTSDQAAARTALTLFFNSTAGNIYVPFVDKKVTKKQ